jgi:hypothetical protein
MVKKKVFSNAASHSNPIAKVLEQPAHPQPVGGLDSRKGNRMAV